MCRRSHNVIAPSEKFAPLKLCLIKLLFGLRGHRYSWNFETGVTRKFAQIFFCEDKDLTRKRSKDPKNAYVTGIFGGRYFLKFFVALEVPSHNFNVEIPRDSNTLDKIPEHHHCFGGTGWIFSYRCMCKIHCERTLLVYLENALGILRARSETRFHVMLIGG